MSADKYPSIFSRQMETVVHIDLGQLKSVAPKPGWSEKGIILIFVL